LNPSISLNNFAPVIVISDFSGSINPAGL